MSENPFPGADPFSGLAPNLKPNPTPTIPEAPSAGDATPPSPFAEPLDEDKINANLVFERPMKLFIPRAIMKKFSNLEFRIINSIPHEIAAATNKGFREITDPEAVALFVGLVAGTDKTGQAYRPLLYARPKSTGKIFANRNREQLAGLYAGMDPKNKELGGKYTSNVDAKDGTKGQFSGAAFRVRTG